MHVHILYIFVNQPDTTIMIIAPAALPNHIVIVNL